MLEQIKKDVLEANRSLETNQLVTLTWGNASGIDRESGLVVIKPSGIPYQDLSSSDRFRRKYRRRKMETIIRRAYTSNTL